MNIKEADAAELKMQITQSDDLGEEICGVEFETTDYGFRIRPRTHCIIAIANQLIEGFQAFLVAERDRLSFTRCSLRRLTPKSRQ